MLTARPRRRRGSAATGARCPSASRGAGRSGHSAAPQRIHRVGGDPAIDHVPGRAHPGRGQRHVEVGELRDRPLRARAHRRRQRLRVVGRRIQAVGGPAQRSDEGTRAVGRLVIAQPGRTPPSVESGPRPTWRRRALLRARRPAGSSRPRRRPPRAGSRAARAGSGRSPGPRPRSGRVRQRRMASTSLWNPPGSAGVETPVSSWVATHVPCPERSHLRDAPNPGTPSGISSSGVRIQALQRNDPEYAEARARERELVARARSRVTSPRSSSPTARTCAGSLPSAGR